MTVETILAQKGRSVATIDPARTLGEAARELSSRRIGAVVIVAAAHRPPSYPKHVAEHAQGVDHELDLAAIAHLGPDGDLHASADTRPEAA